MTLVVEAVDVFDGGTVRIIAKSAEGKDSITFYQPVRMSSQGELLDLLPYAVGDSIEVTVAKK